MKTVSSKRLAVAAAAVIGATGAAAISEAAVIAQWTFESSLPAVTDSPTITGISPESGAGSASGVHASSATDYSNPAGNGSAESFSSNNWADGDYYQFQVSLTDFEDVVVSWDQARSSTGPGIFDFQYSTDGGASFVTALDNYPVLVSTTVAAADATPSNPERLFWSADNGRQSVYTYQVDLSDFTALDNASVLFRLTDDTGTTSAVAGTNRVDNFLVEASAIPEPAGIGLLGVAGLLALRRRRRA